MLHRVLRLARLAALAALVGAATAPAEAGPKAVAWKARATGTTTPDPDLGADVDAFAGKSTLLGRFTGAGAHVLDPATGEFEGQATWTAANGDTLNVTYAGRITGFSGDPDFPFGFEAELVAVGGTGRFAGAEGQAVMTGAFTGVPGELYFSVDGSLTLKRK